MRGFLRVDEFHPSPHNEHYRGCRYVAGYSTNDSRVEKMNRHSKSIRFVKRMVLGLTLLGLSAFGDSSRLLLETPNNFWESNLVATVIGYAGRRSFMGTMIPTMEPSGQDLRQVWLYCIAPTNFARTTFTIHSCGPWSLARVYPTNQLFVFPASVCEKEVNDSLRLGRDYNAPIVPAPTITDYCPYRTFEKWFPITDSQVKYWETYLTENMDDCRRQINRWQQKLKDTHDEKKRAGIGERIKDDEQTLINLQRRIEDLKKQSQYFRGRIEWLETQGVYPEPRKSPNE